MHLKGAAITTVKRQVDLMSLLAAKKKKDQHRSYSVKHLEESLLALN